MNHHNHTDEAEDPMVTDRLRRKLDQVNSAAQSQLSTVQDHINFTLQKAYFKCAYECFDRRRNYDEISNCVEYCGVPVSDAQNLVGEEMSMFRERLQRSLLVCQDKYESSKLQIGGQSNATNNLESCVNEAVDESIETLSFVDENLRTSLGMNDST